MSEQKNNPLHGITLQALLTELVDTLGWEVLADKININCFKKDPSIKSSLKFLRKTPWAREKVEQLYLRQKGHRIQSASAKTTAKKSSASAHPEGFQADIWGKK